MLFTRIFSVAAFLAPFAFVSASPIQSGVAVQRDVALGSPVLPIARAEIANGAGAPLVTRGESEAWIVTSQKVG